MPKIKFSTERQEVLRLIGQQPSDIMGHLAETLFLASRPRKLRTFRARFNNRRANNDSK